MATKTCRTCNQTKDTSEFYVCRRRTDGLQYNCKDCCKIKGKEFREKNPDYYWGKNGYLTKRKDEFSQYVKDRVRADKTCKVYKLTLKDGSIYIGETKTPMNRRMTVHRAEFIQFKGGKAPYVPHLYVFMIGAGYSDEDIQNVWKSVEIIEEFEGTKEDSREREKFWIEEHHKLGYTLRNFIGVPKQHQWVTPTREYRKKHERWNKILGKDKTK